MKSVTRIAFPLIALASAVFTSCGGGGGGEGENPGYYVSVEDFLSGKAGFRLPGTERKLEVMPLGEGKPGADASSSDIAKATEDRLVLPTGGESVHVDKGNVCLPYKPKASRSDAKMDYFVFNGSTGQGILYIYIDGDDELSRAIKNAFSISFSFTNEIILVTIITINLDFSNHTASRYIYIKTQTQLGRNTNEYYSENEDSIPFERM